MEISEAAMNELAGHDYNPVFGACSLKRKIQHYIENLLVTYLLEGKYKSAM